MLNKWIFKSGVIISLILFSATSSSGLLDVEVEIDLGNKTKVWAENMLQKVEAIADRKIADIDDLMKNHENTIFEKIAELSTDIKAHSICVEEKVNQDVHSLFSRFSDSGFLGWLVGPKEKYKQCGKYLDIKVANNALIRNAGVCIYDNAVDDKKSFSDPTTMYALSEDLSNVFFSTWCSNVYKSGFAGSTDIFLRQHSSYAEISIGWYKIQNIKNKECRGTENIKVCVNEFIDLAKNEIVISHKMDIRNGKSLLENLEKKILTETSNKLLNSYIGDIQYILYVIQKNRIEREKIVELRLSILSKELKSMQKSVADVSFKYKKGNVLCSANNYRQVNALFKTRTPASLFGTRNNLSVQIKSFKSRIVELIPLLDKKHKAIYSEIKKLESSYLSEEKLWKLNNTNGGGGRCFVTNFCGQKTHSCNASGVPY